MATKREIPAPLNCEKLLEDCEDEQAYVNQCLHIYVRDAQADMDGIAAALEQSDFPQIARLAHRIKGASSAIRADFLKQQAARLEVLGNREQWIAASETFARLKADFEHFKRFIGTLPALRD